MNTISWLLIRLMLVIVINGLTDGDWLLVLASGLV